MADSAARCFDFPFRTGRRRRSALLAIVAVIVSGGCRLQPQGAAEPAWPNSPAPSITALDTTPRPTRPEGEHFGNAHTYPDGLNVRVFEIRTATLGMFPNASDENAKEGDPYTIISVQVDNNSEAHFEANFVGKLQVGPHLNEAGTVSLDQATSPNSAAPGDSITHNFGFLVPNEAKDDVVFELSIDINQHAKAYFVGSIRTT